MKNTFGKISKLFLFLLVTVLGLGILVGCDQDTEELSSTFMTLSINPEIGMFIDEENVVTDVISLNDDADVLLTELDVTGEEANQAAIKIVAECIETGYINPENETTVHVDVESDEEVVEETIVEKVKKDVNQYFVNKGIFGSVTKDTLEKYGEEAANLDLSIGKTKMVLLALELNPDLNLSDLVSMKTSELVKLCHKEVKNGNNIHAINTEYKDARIVLKEEYANMFSLYDEIETLKASITEEMTEEEKTAINETITTKQAEYDTLKTEFDEKKATLKEEYQIKKQEKKESLKSEKTSKEQKAHSNNQKQEEWFVKNKKKVTEDVEKYQDCADAYNNELAKLEKDKEKLIDLQEKINELTDKLNEGKAEEKLTAEQITLLETEIASKQAEYDVLQVSIQTKLDEIKAKFEQEKANIETLK